MRKLTRVGWLCVVLLYLNACTTSDKKALTLAKLDLTVTVLSPLEVSLSWTTAEGAETYTLERKSEDEENFAVVASLDATVQQTTYTDLTVESGILYTYYLTANANGAVMESAEVSIEVPSDDGSTPEPPLPENPEPENPNPESPPSKIFALSVVPWSYVKDAAGEPEKNMNSAGGSLTVAGRTYKRGLGTQATSEIMYALSGKCAVFNSRVGIDDTSQGSVVFQLFADGVKLWDSGPVKAGDATKATGNISVVDKTRLVLLVQPDVTVPTTEPTTTEPIYANWLKPRLTCTQRPGTASDMFVKGQWGPVFDWQGLVATHLANLPDGRILSWSSWDKNKQGGTPDDFKENTTGYLWNPSDSTFVEMNNPHHDMFCAGLAVLPNGDVFAGGGGNETNLYKTSVFETSNSAYQWRDGPRMTRDHWYGTAVALPDGGVLMSMGSDKGWNSTEVLADGTSTTGTWDLLDGADTGPVLATIGTPTSDIPQPNAPSSSEYEARGWYPYLSVAPKGTLFDAGPVPRLYEFDLTGEGSVTQVGSRNDQLRTWGTYVMYDEGKILVTGGAVIRGDGATNTAVMIDISGEALEVKPAPDMASPRAFHSAVMLPTGEALMVGGNTTGKQFTSEAAVLESEVWNPATNTWRTLAAEARPRAYHSAAILLPDGRVLAAGGGLCGRSGCAAGVDETNGEIYSPPYLFNANGTPAQRPVIAAAPESIGHDETFNVSVTGRTVQTFSLIKLSSITHGINTDLRYLSVPFVKGEDSNYTLTSEENPNVLTPGYYFLFAVDDKGVPSISKTVLVGSSQ
jgi:NPCBM/NEW2 domain/Domain of unknown function (DUF1929)/Galactose oxidase, central domain